MRIQYLERLFEGSPYQYIISSPKLVLVEMESKQKNPRNNHNWTSEVVKNQEKDEGDSEEMKIVNNIDVPRTSSEALQSDASNLNRE